MTLVAAVGFPDEVFIIGDSRMSYPNTSIPPIDELKKVYQLSSHLFFAYTSEDVNFTHKLVEQITIFASQNPKLETGILLNKVTSFAKEKYLEISQRLNKTPTMYFIYAGISTKPLVEDANKIRRLLTLYEKQPYIPEKIKKLDINNSGRRISIPPPTPLLVKQGFPGGYVSATRGWDYTALGSGRQIEKEIEKYFSRLFFFPGGFNKGIILSDLCNQFIENSNIKSVGGIVQIFMINESGAIPIAFEEKTNDVVKRRVYIDQNGNWIEEKNGKKIVSTQRPKAL